MAQADGVIQNDTGSNVRADLNNNFAALFSNSSGSSAPSTTYAYMLWADTTDNELKLRNGANNGWITIGSLTTANLALATTASPTFTGNVTIPLGTVSLPGLRFSGDNDTGLYSTAANTVNVTAGGTLSHSFTSTYSTASVPLRVPDGTESTPSITNTGDENTGLYFISADVIGITTGGTERVRVNSNGLWVFDQQAVRYYDSDSSHYVAVRAPSTVSSNVTLTLPDNNGDNGQYLKTDGSGNLSWGTVSTPAGVPTGSVFCMANTTVPSGYLKCNGAAVSRTTYADLFAAIGTTYGSGNGSTTFNVPELRGEFIRGWDDGRGVDSGRSIASSQGDATALPNNAFTTSNPGNHAHSYKNTASDNIAGVGDNRGYISDTGTGSSTGAAGSHTHTIGGGDAETRPRNVAMMYVIKT